MVWCNNVGTSFSSIKCMGYPRNVDATLICVQKVPFIYGEKLSRVEPPRFTCRNKKQKVGSARRLTRLAGSPFCDGRVTLVLLAGPTFLHINTLARPAGSPRSRRTQRMRERLREHWFTQSERSLLARAKG